MKAKDVMVTDVPTIFCKASVAEAVQRLRKNFGDESFLNAAPGLIVINDKGDLAGILSPLSVISALLESAGAIERPEQTTFEYYDTLCAMIRDKCVEDIMDRQAISVTEDAEVMDAVHLFAAHRFQRIPVIRGSKLVGIIYRSRLMFAMTRCLLA